MCEVMNLDSVLPFDQWELLDCNGHKPSVLCVNCEVALSLNVEWEVFDAWTSKGHFTHKTKSPWPLHFKHSHWWKGWSRSKFDSHYAWGTNRVSECTMDVKSTWIPTWHQIDHVSWSLGLFKKTSSWGRPNTKPGDHGTSDAHNHWFILFYHVRKPAWIEIDWNSVWLGFRSHMASH